MPSLFFAALPVLFSALTLGSLNAGATPPGAPAAEKAQATQTVQLRIIGMITPECPEQVRKAVEPLPGVVSADGDLPSKSATIEFRPDEVSIDAIRKAIKSRAGFDSKVVSVD
jgi:copper chaperone CopZ